MLYKSTNRCGAALIIVIALLACLAIVAGAVLPQILRERYETRLELIRVQSRQLLGDSLRSAEARRKAEVEFSGAEFSLGPDLQPFDGTFYVSTKFVNDAFTAEVEYRNKEGKTVYVAKKH